MFISSRELKRKKIIKGTGNSVIYDLGNGLIGKQITSRGSLIFDLKMQKIALSERFDGVSALSCPVDILETEYGIVGYIQKKRNGISFADYVFSKGDVPLDVIVDYYCRLENILKQCHNLGMVFPDTPSDGNVIYDEKTGEINILDYDGNQIDDITTGEISRTYVPFFELLQEPKFSRVSGSSLLFNKNLDVLGLLIRFLFTCTHVNISRYGFSVDDLEWIILMLGFEDTLYAEQIRSAFESSGENDYISEALQELKHDYVLRPCKETQGRIFTRK